MTSEIGKVEKYVIISLPVVSILAAGLLFHIMFPNYRDLAGWFQFEMSSIPFILWSVLGAVSGFIVGLIIRLKPDLFRSYSRRIVAGFFGWLLLSVIISSLTEEGNLFDRLAQGPLFKAWAVIFLISISGSPTFLGIVAVMGRKRTAIAGSILMFFMLAASCMVFSQADSAKVISQGPFLSVLFVWSLISFVESVNWMKRYVDRDPSEFPSSPSGKDLLGILWHRQLYYTIIFLGIASLIAILPFFLPEIFDMSSMWIYSFYESSAVVGKVIISLVILFPLALLSLGRRYLDIIKGAPDGEHDDDGTI